MCIYIYIYININLYPTPRWALQSGTSHNLGQNFAKAFDVQYQTKDQKSEYVRPPPTLTSHKVFLKSFCRSQIPHESVNVSFTITNMKHKLTDLGGD